MNNNMNIKNFSEKSAEVATEASKMADNMKDNVKNKVKDISENLQDKAYEAGSVMKDKAGELQEFMTNAVKEHPIKTLGLTFLAGFMLSKCKSSKN